MAPLETPDQWLTEKKIQLLHYSSLNEKIKRFDFNKTDLHKGWGKSVFEVCRF
jgi:hypothetical protein